MEQLERPSVYDSGAENENEEIKATDVEGDGDNEDFKIPTPEEIFENIENPTPSTSKGIKAKPVKNVKTDKFDSLSACGQNLFIRGAEFDGAIEATLDKLRRSTALKIALEMSQTNGERSAINAKIALLARQGVNEDLDRYKDRLVYLIGNRRRLLDVLVAQQERAEESLDRGDEPTLAQLGLTIEADEDSNDQHISEDMSRYQEDADVEEQNVVPETELDISHVSSNLSEPGMCNPQDPCQDDPCRHMGGE